MSDLQRWTTELDEDGFNHHVKSEDGEWVEYDDAATALREQAQRIAALEAENESLRADLQGAEQRVLQEFESWCTSLANDDLPPDAHVYRRASAIAYTFRCQRIQAEGE